MKIKIENLHVQIKKKVILDGIFMELEPGIYGVIGANGAGKTTLFRALLGLQDYTGTIDKSCVKQQEIGYLPQRFETLQNLSVEETLEYFCCLKKIPTESQKEEIDRVLTLTNLQAERTKLVRKLSGGMHQRLGVAQALLGDSKLLILDEPTVGLDPRERQNFRQVLSVLQERKDQQIVLISSHEMQELDLVCDKVIFLHQGELIAYDDIQALFAWHEVNTIEEAFFKLTEGV